MKNFLSRLKKNENGQDVVEFALVAVPLLLLLLGIIEFGWIFNGQITLTSAAREGARVAAVSGTQAQVEEAVERHAGGSALTIDDVQVAPGADDVTVLVVGRITPLVGFFVKGDMDLSAQAIMRQE